jgi:hypothetical protein
MTGILSLWDGLVELTAVIAIVVIAIGLMIGMIDAHRALVRLGAVLGCLALLLILPLILVGLWHSLDLRQQFEIATLFGLVGLVTLRSCASRKRKRNREH